MKCSVGKGSPARELVQIVPNVHFCIYLDDGKYLPKIYTIREVRPYLRPMSSMTAEEILEIDNMQTGGDFDLPNGEGFTWLPNPDICDYLNSIHVDYRGLIPKGLAVAVTPENNPYKL